MKKSLLFICFIILSLASTTAACNLDATLINQDPYPAIPGEYVSLVFQVIGVEDPTCKTVSFELLENYPISFDPNESAKRIIKGGTYSKDYNSYLSIPYEVRIDKDALDGETKIEARFGEEGTKNIYQLETFYLEVEDVRANFEIHIEDYSYTTKELTLEILNIADSDIEALTLEIPDQNNIDIIGTNRVIAGDLDSNEYTTADFKADIKDGEIKVNILYTDSTGTRRTLTKDVDFDSKYFKQEENSNSSSIVYIIITIIIIVIIGWWILRKRKKKRAKHKNHSRRGSARLG